MAESLTIHEHNGKWSVATHNNTEIVSFAGPGAFERAVRQYHELSELLNWREQDNNRAFPRDEHSGETE